MSSVGNNNIKQIFLNMRQTKRVKFVWTSRKHTFPTFVQISNGNSLDVSKKSSKIAEFDLTQTWESEISELINYFSLLEISEEIFAGSQEFYKWEIEFLL